MPLTPPSASAITPSATFQAFSSSSPSPPPYLAATPLRQGAFGQAISPISETTHAPELDAAAPPPTFESDTWISPKRAIGMFAVGLGIAVTGKKMLGPWLRRAIKASKGPEPAYTESQTYLFFQKPLSSLFVQSLSDHRLTGPLLTYASATGLGYLASNLVQGFQEAWVRREETGIRARLLARLNQTFRQSIRSKQASDDQLQAQTKQQLRVLLNHHGVTQTEALLQEAPTTNAGSGMLDTWRRYFFEPTHREQPVAGSADLPSLAALAPLTPMRPQAWAMRFGKRDQPDTPDAFRASQPPPSIARGMDVIFATGGLVAGLLVQGFKNSVKDFRVVMGAHDERVKSEAKKVIKNVSHHDVAALLVLAQRLNTKPVVLAYGALVGIAGAGKLMIDGLREIAVTQANAKTEYAYQQYNWTQLDPQFHQIAEREATQHALDRLNADLPFLKNNPKTLATRVHQILRNIGMNSAPKYFTMTPSVGITAARA